MLQAKARQNIQEHAKTEVIKAEAVTPRPRQDWSEAFAFCIETYITETLTTHIFDMKFSTGDIYILNVINQDSH